MQPEPYLKGIFTCFSLSSNAFSSSDARTIPLSVWFSCKGVGNVLNGKRLKTPTKKKIKRRKVCINRQTHLLNNFYSGYQWDIFKCFHACRAAFSLATLSVLTAKKTKQKNFVSTIHNLAANSTMISESFYLSSENLILLSKHIMQTPKYLFIERDEQPRKWHISDLLLLTILISEQILRNGFEKTASFLSYTGGLHFLQALLRTIINSKAWSTDMCLFLWTAHLRPLAGPRTTTAESAHCCP